LLEAAWDLTRRGLLEAMPALEKDDSGTTLPLTNERAMVATVTPAEESGAPNLVDLDLLLDSNPEIPQPTAVATDTTPLKGTETAPQPVSTSEALFDIFNSVAEPVGVILAEANAPVLNLFDPAPLETNVPAADVEFPATATLDLIAYEDEHLRVDFTCTKPYATSPSTTSIDSTVTNKATDTISDFNLLAAVPKHLKLALQPASGTVMQAGGTIT
jgi:hypothetical protein